MSNIAIGIGIQTKYFLLDKFFDHNDDLLSSKNMKTIKTNILLSHFMTFTSTSSRNH